MRRFLAMSGVTVVALALALAVSVLILKLRIALVIVDAIRAVIVGALLMV